MSEANPIPKIFLSYAREDYPQVEELYQYLSTAGFKPWMDKHDILPGEVWFDSIQNAIEGSDFFIACMSGNSVDKRGVLQKEIKSALDAWQGMLDNDIYLIPVRLEECQVPDRLGRFQYVDLFEKGGWSQLERAIREGMERRTRKSIPTTTRPIENIKRHEKITKTSWLTRYRFQVGLILTALALFISPWIYNNNFHRVPRPNVPTTFCQASPRLIQVGVAELAKCSPDFRENLKESWNSEKTDVSFLSESFATSIDARNNNYDILVWGECIESNANTATLRYELITSRKPFEIYEPTTLLASDHAEKLARLGLAIIDYRYGDYAEALRLFGSLPVTTASADLLLLEANSFLFDLQPVPAISEFKEITQEFASDSAGAYNNLGVVVAGDDRNQALGWFNQAVVLAEDNKQVDVESLARVNRSQVFLSDRKWKEARDDCNRATVLSPKSAHPYVCLAKYNFSYFRFGAPWLPLPLNEINKNLNEAEKYPDTLPMTHYIRADWHLSHSWKQKQEAVNAYMRYLSEMENRACLQADRKRNADTQGFLDELTVHPK